MSLTYNTIELDPFQLTSHEREDVYHGPTYLYTLHRISGVGVYNPGAASYLLDTDPNAPYVTGGDLAPEPRNPPAQPGQLAPTTDLAVRHALAQPRRPLLYDIDEKVVLSSPSANKFVAGMPLYATDAANGPKPIVHSIEPHGYHTFKVAITIEVAVNECELVMTSKSASALLSHRWEMSQSIDSDAYTTRTIRGQAIFRSDRLLALGSKPDDYRAWLFHPIPDNFRRDDIQVKLADDGLSIFYSCVDRETCFNVMIPGVRIEASYSRRYRSTGLENGLSHIQSAFGGVGDAIVQGVLGGGGIPDILRLVKAGQEFNKVFGRLAPKMIHSLVVRVWGQRTTTRKQLYAVAGKFITDRFNSILLKLGEPTEDVTEDVMGKFVEVIATSTSGPVGSVLLAGPLGLGGFPKFPFAPDEVAGVTTSGVFANPAPPNDSGTRGTYIEACIAQALQYPCSSVTNPDGSSRQPGPLPQYSSLNP